MDNKFSYELCAPVGKRANIGLITLQTDETIESDMRHFFPEKDVGFYVSRIACAPETTKNALSKMEADLPRSAKLLPPPIKFDVVGYGCTSGTAVIGAEKISKLISSGCNTQKVTDPLTALISACDKLNISRLGFLSPYVADVSLTLRTALKRNGIDSPAFGSFNESTETNVAKISGKSLLDASVTLSKQASIEAIFLSCTNLQTIKVIEEIEDKCGLPVMSSNQVLAWHMRSLSSLALTPRAVGSLMR